MLLVLFFRLHLWVSELEAGIGPCWEARYASIFWVKFPWTGLFSSGHVLLSIAFGKGECNSEGGKGREAVQRAARV